MKYFLFFILFLLKINGQIINELLSLKCSNPIVTLHIYSSQPNPQWKLNKTQTKSIQKLANLLLQRKEKEQISKKFSERVMGYQGFSLTCSNYQIFIHRSISIEQQLLQTGKSLLSSEIINHVNLFLGQSSQTLHLRNYPRINCNHVPIKGPDTVPVYNPFTDNGGCFITKQSNNNCYAYGVDIVTNTYPQPGRSNGKSPSSITCQSIRNASIRDGLVYKGTTLPNDQPKAGHYLALFIWPNVDYHWIRKDQNGYWSHKPGTGRVTNRDNTGSWIYNPLKSNLTPWGTFCGYYIAQPSKIHIY